MRSLILFSNSGQKMNEVKNNRMIRKIYPTGLQQRRKVTKTHGKILAAVAHLVCVNKRGYHRRKSVYILSLN